MSLPYLVSVREAVARLHRARAAVLDLLSDEQRKEEWELRFSTVTESARWNELYHRHGHLTPFGDLTAIVLALEKLTPLLEQAAPATTPNLTLKKARPSFAGHGK